MKDYHLFSSSDLMEWTDHGSHGNAIDTYVQCDTFTTEQYKAIPLLDLSTSYSKEEGVVFINVVNRHKENAITADITSSSGNYTGKAEASIINMGDMQQAFEYDKRDQYIPVKKRNRNKSKPTYLFLPSTLVYTKKSFYCH